MKDVAIGVGLFILFLSVVAWLFVRPLGIILLVASIVILLFGMGLDDD